MEYFDFFMLNIMELYDVKDAIKHHHKLMNSLHLEVYGTHSAQNVLEWLMPFKRRAVSGSEEYCIYFNLMYRRAI